MFIAWGLRRNLPSAVDMKARVHQTNLLGIAFGVAFSRVVL